MKSFHGLLHGLGLDVAGWQLGLPSVSADGNVFVGQGLNPEGETEAWVAIIPATYVPEPNAALILLVLVPVALSQKRLTH
jgi:hypothetical protein